MPLSLVRIDDRLIHGQVVLGWSRLLQPDRLVLANDRVAGSAWERRFYTASVPTHMKLSFLSIEETAMELTNNLFRNESVVMLFESVRDAHDLMVRGIALDEINLGGLHYRDGAEEILPYVFLTPDDRAMLRELVKRGVRLLAQDVPGNSATILNSMIV